MIQPTMVGAVVAVAGAILTIAARDSRLVAAGLFVTMVATPLVSSPEPTAAVLAFRFVGALLVAYLLWATTRSGSIDSEGSGLGIPAETIATIAAFCVGWFAMPVQPLAGPLAAQAAGFALVVVALGPLAGRNVLRIGAAIALLALGISLLMEAWTAPATSLDQIVLTALLVGIVGATSLLISPSVAVEAAAHLTAEPLAPGAVAGRRAAVRPGTKLRPAVDQVADHAAEPADRAAEPPDLAAEPADRAAAAMPVDEPATVEPQSSSVGRARRLGVRERRQ